MNSGIAHRLFGSSLPLNWLRRPMFKTEYKKDYGSGVSLYRRDVDLFNKRSRKLGTY